MQENCVVGMDLNEEAIQSKELLDSVSRTSCVSCCEKYLYTDDTLFSVDILLH